MLRHIKAAIGVYIGFSLFAIVVFLLPRFVGGLDGQQAWILRIVLTALGAAVAGAALYYFNKKKGEEEAAAGEEGGAGAAGAGGGVADEEIDGAVAAAQQRLAGAKLAGGGKLGTLPVVLVLGPEGATKTTMVVRGGIEPELLAGEVFHGDQIVPTSAVNLWFARGAVFAEAAGKVTGDPAKRARFLQRLRPQRLGAALGRGTQAPRVAVVCFPCDEFLKPGSTEAVPAAARQLREALAEAAETLGIKLPVYVLFTKADRIPGFADYVQTLTRDEAREPLGVTLPAMAATGTYAEQETARLTDAFRRLYESLAARRLLVLHREHSAERKPGAYEFPREFRKVAPLAMQFLVELGRPSQLAVSQFLRGFYFTGVRAVVVQEQVAAPAPSASGPSPIAGATSVFGALRAPGTPGAPSAPSSPAAAVQKKKPQWVFLDRLFPDVVLADQAALRATQGGTRVSGMRRAMLAAAALLALFVGTGFTISFFGNRSLEQRTISAGSAAKVAEAPAVPTELPAEDALVRLDSLRQMVALLGDYRVDGAPMRLRWALYAGDRIEPDARALYFQEFERVMFGATRESLLRTLRALPDSISETAEYGATYDLLKGYLITASHADKSTVQFLPPVLMRAWLDGRELDSARTTLARRQFDYYAGVLQRDGDPYTVAADEPAVEHARDYLLQFAGADRVYQFMLAQAARQHPGIQFNRAVPGSAAYVVNTYEVPGGFTAGGWTFMQDALKNVDKFLEGEEWVLGPRVQSTAVDRARVAAELRTRYDQDFVRHWREYLKAGRVVRYENLGDAATKLQMHGGPNSPVLAMLAIAARNTGMDSAATIRAAFQPVHAVTPPTATDRYVVEQNQPYAQALGGLGLAIDQVAKAQAPQVAMMAQSAQGSATQATGAVMALAGSFALDTVAHVENTVQALLLAPIKSVDAFLNRNFGGDEVNAAGATFCSSYTRLLNKYPFNPNASSEATVDEVAAIFKPGTGLLYTTYDEVLQPLLVKQGTTVAARPGAPVRANPSFVSFYNRALLFSDAFFRNGVAEPRLAFSLRSQVADPISQVTIALDQQVARFTAANSDPAPFIWQASQSQSARLGGVFGGGSELNLQGPFTGPWALFKLFHRAERWTGSGGVYTVEWPVRMPGQTLTRPDGSPVTVTVQMNLGGLPPVLQKGYFDNLRCVSRVAN